MKVKAKALGYYASKIVDIGEVFELKKEEHFSKTWMIDVDGVLEKKEAKKVKAEKEKEKELI